MTLSGRRGHKIAKVMPQVTTITARTSAQNNMKVLTTPPITRETALSMAVCKKVLKVRGE